MLNEFDCGTLSISKDKACKQTLNKSEAFQSKENRLYRRISRSRPELTALTNIADRVALTLLPKLAQTRARINRRHRLATFSVGLVKFQ